MAACVLMNGWGVQAQEMPGTFPAAPGKQVVVRACTGCHDVETVIGSRRTKLGWRQNVDVNTATAQDLEKMLELSAREAQEIVSYREKNGTIKDLRNRRKFPG